MKKPKGVINPVRPTLPKPSSAPALPLTPTAHDYLNALPQGTTKPKGIKGKGTAGARS